MAPKSKEATLDPIHNEEEIPHDFELKDATVYDQMLRPNENRVLKYLRHWERKFGFVTPLLYTNLISISLLHIITLVWILYNLIQWNLPKWQTVVFCDIIGHAAGFGVTAGVHRLFTHRSFKAKWPLKAFLLLCFSTAGQNTVYEWVRDHRVHHKYSETLADPHDSRRGLFFSHCGWLMMKKHPKVKDAGSKVDMSDIVNDPLVKMHEKYDSILKIACCFVIPTVIPVLMWNETWHYAIFLMFYRYLRVLNYTWSVNSFAHIFGNKPYDSKIGPADNIVVAYFSMGEGWHNYHHTFPWDYKASELPYKMNLTTFFLDMFGAIGWAYDFKTASPSVVKAVKSRKADLNLD